MNQDKKGFFAVLNPDGTLFTEDNDVVHETERAARGSVARTGPTFSHRAKLGYELVEFLPVPVSDEPPVNVYLISGRCVGDDDDTCGLYQAQTEQLALASFLQDIFIDLSASEALELAALDEGDDPSYFIITGPIYVGALRNETVLEFNPSCLS